MRYQNNNGKFYCPDTACKYYTKHKILPIITEVGFMPPFCKLGFCRYDQNEDQDDYIRY